MTSRSPLLQVEETIYARLVPSGQDDVLTIELVQKRGDTEIVKFTHPWPAQKSDIGLAMFKTMFAYSDTLVFELIDEAVAAGFGDAQMRRQANLAN